MGNLTMVQAEPNDGPRYVSQVQRRDDMSPHDRLALFRDESGDVVVSVMTSDGMQSVEFCTIGAGGGRSPRTFRALVALMEAMEDDHIAEQAP